MKKAFLFPGQGSQAVGMAADIISASDTAQNTLGRACDILGFDLKKIILEGPMELLTATENAQPALFVISLIIAEELKNKGIYPDFCLGHSLGELTGAVCGGFYGFEEGLKIIRKRGELMRDADPEGKGGMAAVIGAEEETIKKCAAMLGNDEYVVCANFNSPGQIVISGLKTSVEKIIPLLKEAGAKRVLPLNVSGAFHSKLMSQASDRFADFIKQFQVKNPSCPILSNYSADIHTIDNIQQNLAMQMTNPVRFTACVNKLKESGIAEYYEVGPGKVLAGLIGKIDPQIKVINVNSLEYFSDKP